MKQLCKPSGVRVRTFCLYFKHSNQKIALKKTHFVKPFLFKLKRGLVEDSCFGVSYNVRMSFTVSCKVK